MRTIKTQIEIHASPDAVWRVLTDFGSYPEWNPVIPEIEGDLRPGGSLRVYITAPGLASRRVKVKVIEVERTRTLRWLGRLIVPGLLDGDHSFELSSSTDREHVIVTQQERFSGLLVPFVAPWLIPNMSHAFERMNAALKVSVEESSYEHG